jgi:hypothetical protein
MAKICFDYDYLLYAAASMAETRSIVVTHKQSGDQWEFPNRTLFWGHHKAKAGGWLAEWNSKQAEDKRRKADEFDLVDKQEPEPIENAIHTLKQMIKAVKEEVGVSVSYGYTGRGKSFREGVSTIIKYKGNRDDSLRPILLDPLRDYLVARQSAEIITGIEADDAVSVDSYNAWKKWKKTGNEKDKVVVGCVDKDYKQCPGHLKYPEQPLCSYGEGFGFLQPKEKGYTGRGRLWLYFQVLAGDSADNYFANSASPVKWGEASAYKALAPCKNDQEALQALVNAYKHLYPSSKKIIGWRGQEIEIDAMYCLQENFTLARMLRARDEKPVIFKDVLDSLKVEYV